MLNFTFREYFVDTSLQPQIVKVNTIELSPGDLVSSFRSGKFARQYHMDFILNRPEDIYAFNCYVNSALINNLLVSVSVVPDDDEDVGTEASTGTTSDTWFNGFIKRVVIDKDVDVFNIVSHSTDPVSSGVIKTMRISMLVEEIDQASWDEFVG